MSRRRLTPITLQELYASEKPTHADFLLRCHRRWIGFSWELVNTRLETGTAIVVASGWSLTTIAARIVAAELIEDHCRAAPDVLEWRGDRVVSFARDQLPDSLGG